MVNFAPAARSLAKNVEQIGDAAGDMFKGIAHKTRAGLAHLDGVVKNAGGFKAAYNNAWDARPVTTLAVTGGVVAGTGFVGANMARAALRSDSRGRDR